MRVGGSRQYLCGRLTRPLLECLYDQNKTTLEMLKIPLTCRWDTRTSVHPGGARDAAGCVGSARVMLVPGLAHASGGARVLAGVCPVRAGGLTLSHWS